MGELMQMSVADVQNDRLGVALACAQKFNAIVVLKGARSVVAMPNGRTFFNLPATLAWRPAAAAMF
jgi:NAD(P)H-hydrate epimerase